MAKAREVGVVKGGEIMARLGCFLLGVCIALTVLGSTLSADIAPARQFGTSLAPWASSGICMTREIVKIRLRRKSAEFHATFWLKNGSDKPVSLDVGFPDVVGYGVMTFGGDADPSGPYPRLRNFKVETDGKPIEAAPRYYRSKVALRDLIRLLREDRRRAREIAEVTDPAEKARLNEAFGRECQARGWWRSGGWLAWRMSFARGESKRVEVSYDLPYRPAYYSRVLGFNAVEYVLKSGALWDGPIGQAIIEIELAEGLQHGHMEKLEPAGYSKTKTGFRWDLRSIEPAEDVKIVLRDYVDFRDALQGYRKRADAAESEGDARKAASLRCAAWESAQKLEPTEAEIDLARRILGYERAVVAESGTGFGVHPRVRIDLRVAYVPWEWRLVQSLERNGRKSEAREAARIALPVLERWKEDHQGRNANWGRVELKMLNPACEHCRKLIQSK